MIDQIALQAHILKQAARKEGFSTKVLTRAEKKKAGSIACNLCGRGKLFACRVSHRNTRYFATQALADAFTRANTMMQKIMPNQGGAKASWAVDAPMRITKATKYTIAPPPPERVYRTNTYSF